jgi:phosphoglycerate kinase
MEKLDPESRLKILQNADIRNKIVLTRVDHNVVKKGEIKDPYRIDSTIGTIYAIAAKGGKPVLMTHVGRPRDKKTGNISCKPGESVEPIVRYLEKILPIRITVPDFPVDPEKGILHLDDSIGPLLEKLKTDEIGMIYLPNIRWFQGEQSKGPEKETFARELASIADVYVNDAFGSWQAHVSTFEISRHLPSFAGTLLQKEINNLALALEPERPFVAVIAGSKYDTKIGPLKALHRSVDRLILGGLMYNTYLAAKYGVKIKGVSEEDSKLAAELVKLDESKGKICEMPYVVESDTLDGKIEGQYRTKNIHELKRGEELNYILDVDPLSFQASDIMEAFDSAKTIFLNAVMGYMPHFPDGSKMLYDLVSSKNSAMKLFGGGDTLQEFKNLSPGAYLKCLDDSRSYYFTGGGAVLSAIENGSPYALETIKALLE